ncbi:MAG: quinoprotein dehydrogenase-associated SoxYZ-like carrier [Gammaproteobacteria bacterium]|jgi:sulfur-oxidizing protein SoxY|nr:quinoprotein dehydrogenase-associated SoxYZ-like carrier [Gammaproteobacteria bacterium]
MQTAFTFRTLFYTLLIICTLSIPNISQAEVQAADHRQKLSDKAWEPLRKAVFQSREIIEGAEQTILEIKAPYRAEDATIVPVSIHTKIPQTKDLFIKKIHVYIDKNPLPLVGVFDLSPESGRADLAMRVRVDTFTYIRAIAEMNTGELYMSKSFVRATGACSAPPPKSISDSIDNMGRMKIKNVGELELSKPNLVQLKIKHPNITGLQPMRIGSRVMPPPHFISGIKVYYEGKTIMQANLTFSVSMDPSFRFYFTPKSEGTLTVEASDTKNNQWNSSYEVKSSS